jgi:signal transduction histidine kinase
MTRRLLLSYLIVTALVLVLLEVPLAVFYSQRERERIAADVEHDATVLATLYEDDLENGLPLDSGPADQYRDRTGARVVVVDRDGITQVDTDQTAQRDFSTRPEIESALAGNTASGTRSSETLGTDLLYVAVPVASGGTVHGALRVNLDTSDVNARIHRFWRSLAGIAAVVLAVVTVVGWGIARSVTRPIRQLNRDAARFAHGDLTVSPDPITGPPEVRALADTMSTMARRLDELLRSQRTFIADASHQLRTPLTALRLRLDNIQSQLPAQSSAELDAAIDETTRLAALVTSLLQLARADEHPATGIADLARLTIDRADTWSAVADANGVTLIADTPPGSVLVRADPAAVEHILDNLLDNALNASPSGTTITARITSHANTRDLTISDQGAGLTDEDKQLATQRFWRGDTTTAGTGLGLAIVDALATASHARLHLADAPDGGLAATISFLAANPPTTASQ